MKKLLSLFLLVFISIQVSQSQVPQSFNYQAVLRDASGNTLTNVNVAVITSLTQGTIDGTVVFAETHTGTTNEYGLINLQIGSINTSGFSEIDWTGGPYFLNINVNGTDLGTSQLLSNPFALVAEDVINKDDADADPLNEIQILSISNDTIFLSDGAYVKLPPDEVDDADPDPANELQELTFSNDSLSISKGNSINLPISIFRSILYPIGIPNYNLAQDSVVVPEGKILFSLSPSGGVFLTNTYNRQIYDASSSQGVLVAGDTTLYIQGGLQYCLVDASYDEIKPVSASFYYNNELLKIPANKYFILTSISGNIDFIVLDASDNSYLYSINHQFTLYEFPIIIPPNTIIEPQTTGVCGVTGYLVNPDFFQKY